jgi:hypothetical protein
MAPKAVNAAETLQPEQSLSRAWPAPTRHESRALPNGGSRIHGGIYKGSSPCWYARRPSRRGPTARVTAHGPESG